MALMKQKPIHITVCHKYHPGKSLNSYHELKFCIMFLLTNPKLLLLYYVQVLCQNEIHIDTLCVWM